jgi:alpha-beta hydrolase superfamily lysophospholipase
MNSSDGWYEGAGGERLFVRAWRPPGEARASVIFVHGLGDHSGLHPAVSEALVPLRVTVTAPDLRGNGRSPGRRGHVDAWDEFREDLRRLVLRVRATDPDIPLFLVGFSLGGLVVLDYALHHADGVRGVIALAPPLGELGVPRVLLALGRVVSRVWPGFSLRTGMDLSGLARDPQVVRDVRADPLFHRLGSARLSTEVTATITRVQEQAPDFPLPVLILHGDADRMVLPEGSRRFIGRVGQADKRLIEYPGAYHALVADTGRERVLADLCEWILRRS